MLTYSQLVDRAVARAVRPDSAANIQDFVNQTVKDAHSTPDNRAVLFAKNLVEDTLTTNISAPFIWIPPIGFQRMLTVRYPGIQTPKYPLGVYPLHRTPGQGQNDKDYFYYRAGAYFAFAGCGDSGSSINVAYYGYPTRLKYYAEADRPASYDLEEGWTYLAAYDIDATTRAEAEALVTNWIIFDWFDYTFEGTMSKLFKLLKDTERASTHYSAFQQQRTQLFTAEVVETLAR